MTLDITWWKPASVLARRCGVAPTTIHRWHREGKLDRVKVGHNDYRYWWRRPAPAEGTFIWVGKKIVYTS